MTTRRTFLGSSLFAASAASLPRPALGQSPGRTGRIKTKDGIELFVKDTGGPGRAIVLTHAWPLNADIWDYQAAALSMAGYRVVTYDRRGFGRSDKPESGYRFDVLADDLAAVIEQTGVRDATIVGYSMGSFLGVTVAASEPAVRAVVLAAGGDLPAHTPLSRLIRSVADPLRAVRRLAGRPLLMVHGRQDHVVRPEQAERLFAAAGEPKTLRWYDAGHRLPPDVIRDAAGWLREQLLGAPADQERERGATRT